MSTFLELVNDAIAESKQALDPLTSANFAAPTRSVLYTRLKNWVRQSYIDLLEERREWFFSHERGVVTIQPRLHLAALSPGYIPQIGDVLGGDQSEAVFEITEVFADNEGDDSGTEYTIGVRFEEAEPLVQWETVTAYRGMTEFAAAARIENRGTYKLQQYIPTVDWVDLDTITIKLSVLDPDFSHSPSAAVPPLTKVDWPQWMQQYNNFYSAPGHPRYVARAPNGDLQFYPFPDRMYDIAFEYEQVAPPLVDWDDVPSLLPAKHHQLLVWKALIELADFNNDRTLYARANKKYLERLGWLMRDFAPSIVLETSRFYRR